jgi:hypothetical protein
MAGIFTGTVSKSITVRRNIVITDIYNIIKYLNVKRRTKS